MSERPREVLLGRYCLGERLATGGMGEIRLALQVGVGRFSKPVAIKLLLPHLVSEPAAVEMFLDEARLASQMNHPNVVQIFDVGIENDQYFIAMELVKGVAMSTLISALRKEGRHLPGRILEYVGRSLCEGLHHAHEKVGPDGVPLGIVHRDVTPHNVLLSVEGEVKLTDFGIARAFDQSSYTRPGTFKGKLEYMAPEQLSSREFDRRVDVYGAGVTLFQLATLSSPFRRDTDEQMFLAIRRDPLPSLSELRSDLPSGYISAVQRATQKNAEDRFFTARAFRDAIASSTSSSSAEELGECVRELCRVAIERLEQKTMVTLDLHSGARVPVDEGTTQVESRASLKDTRFSALTLAGAVVAAAAFAAAGAWWSLQVPPDEAALPISVVKEPSTVDAGTFVHVLPAQPPAVPAEEPQSAPLPTEEPRRTAVRPPKKTVPGVGYLSVDAIPWAKVSIDGENAGYTPLASYPVRGGVVTVVLENPNNGKVVKRQVKVVGGMKFQMKEDLR